MTGWAWDYVEQTLTVPRLQALHKEWQMRPPLPVMVASYLGIKPAQKSNSEELVSRLMNMHGVRIDKAPGR